MANLHDCLDTAVQAGELDRARAEVAKEEFERLVAKYATAMPRHQAEATAAQHLKEATRRAQRSRRHAVLNQLQAMVRIRNVVMTADTPEKAPLAILESRMDDGLRGESVRFVTEGLQARIRSELKEFLDDAGLNVVGSSRDPALVRKVVRELHGQDTGSASAKAHADAIRKPQKWLRQMFNAQGGDIGEIADYGLRHTHDPVKLRRVGFDAWAESVFEKLDWHRIINRTTGEPFAARGARPRRADATNMLREVYENITTDGWNSRDPKFSTNGRALYNQRSDPRILHFRDGDAWMEYNAAFGGADLFSALVGGLDAMARDVGLMRVLGPNPNGGLEYAIQLVEKAAALSKNEKRIKLAGQNAKKARVMIQHLNGAINDPHREQLAKVFSNVRHFNVATRLGSAILSAAGDLATVTVGSAAMGRNPVNILSRGVQQLVSSGSRQEAARAGFVAETLMSIGASSARLTNDVVGNDTFGRMSGFTIRATGLAYWTDQWRVAVQMDIAGDLADHAGKALDDLPRGLRAALERNGINEADWDVLRSAPMFEPRPGATFISPLWWLEHQTALPRAEAESLAIRLQGAFQEQLETLVPTRRIRGSATLIGDSKPGTAGGELLRSTAGFKNYATSFTIGQVALFNSLPTPQSKIAYVSSMAAATVLLGAFSMQLKQLAKGNDPQPMDTPKFWLAATAQGGGLGIFGDFFFSETSRLGGGIEQALAGPVAGLVGDIVRPVASNIQLAAEGKDTKFGRDAANLLRRNTPFLSSAWYTRVAFDRAVADQLQNFLDPEADRQMRQAAGRLEREYGTYSWWQRGRLQPSRGPDLSNALGDLQ